MITSMLYYTGLMGYLIEKVAWLFQRTCGTTGAESMVVIANIFLSMTESPLIVKPFLHDMTKSEMFVVMCAGMASVAGSVMGAFIQMGFWGFQKKNLFFRIPKGIDKIFLAGLELDLVFECL